MAEDTLYPQYKVRVRWENDGEHNPAYPKWHEGLPEGRTWNSASLNRMYREDPGAAEVERWAREEWWPEYAASEKIASKNPGEPEITVEAQPPESWMLSWFEHWTFDVGQTDQEALASFDRFVSRYERMQDRISPGEYPEGYRCLMGAEDRWRWHAGPNPEDRNPPPCRCEHCKAQGKVRIAH